MGWGMGNDFKEATQAATPDLARAYALQGQLDNAAQARVDAVRANNAAGIIGLGEKGFSEYKDWKANQDLSENHWATKKTPSVFDTMQNEAMAARAANTGVTLDTPFINKNTNSMKFAEDYSPFSATPSPVQMGGPLRGLAPYEAPLTGVLSDGYNMDSMISDFGSGAAPYKLGGPLQGAAPYQAPNTGVLPDGYNMDSMISDFGSGAAPAPSSGGWSGVPKVVGADDFTSTPMVDGLMSDAKSMFSRGADNVGQFADFAGNSIMGTPQNSNALADALRGDIGADIGADIGVDIGADVAADVAGDATIDAASTALDGLGGTAGVSALEGILSGDDAGTIAKDVALDAGQAALLSSLGLTGPLGWGVGALISLLRG